MQNCLQVHVGYTYQGLAAAAGHVAHMPCARHHIEAGSTCRGYESMVMLRMLREGGPSQVPVILSDWASVLPRQTEAWGESAEGMMRQFEEIRWGTWGTAVLGYCYDGHW
jgi:hypothetical protein